VADLGRHEGGAILAVMNIANLGFGAIVEKTDDFVPAFEAALRSGKPAVIEIRIDPDAVSPMATLSGLRRAALDKAKG